MKRFQARCRSSLSRGDFGPQLLTHLDGFRRRLSEGSGLLLCSSAYRFAAFPAGSSSGYGASERSRWRRISLFLAILAFADAQSELMRFGFLVRQKETPVRFVNDPRLRRAPYGWRRDVRSARREGRVQAAGTASAVKCNFAHRRQRLAARQLLEFSGDVVPGSQKALQGLASPTAALRGNLNGLRDRGWSGLPPRRRPRWASPSTLAPLKGSCPSSKQTL